MKIGLIDVDDHAQPYRDPTHPNEPPKWQKVLASWCNKRQLYATIDFTEFIPRKGFCCNQYFTTK